MSAYIFRNGTPHSLIQPMYNDGYGVDPGLVDPDFTGELLQELKEHGKYYEGQARLGREPGVKHDQYILNSLGEMPRLAEFRHGLNDTITEVSGFDFHHLTYLTVRVCPVDAMSSRIHRNDVAAGPWLVALTLGGSGSINVYPDDVIDQGAERTLFGDERDPEPLATSPMRAGDAWGAYSGKWSVPHAGGRNTSLDPKVIMLLYGWHARSNYPGLAPMGTLF